jgi:DNA-binding MarR family transcriptional regulator
MDSVRIPSYYTIIPAPVRYDQELSYFEIVLFSELVAMSTVQGYAFVSNSYLATLYNKDITTITRALKTLSSRKHINIEIDQVKGNERRIYIITPPIGKNAYTPIGKNADRSRAGQNASFSNKEIFNNNYPQTPPGASQPTPGKRVRKTKQNQVPDVVIPWLDDYIASLK